MRVTQVAARWSDRGWETLTQLEHVLDSELYKCNYDAFTLQALLYRVKKSDQWLVIWPGRPPRHKFYPSEDAARVAVELSV